MCCSILNIQNKPVSTENRLFTLQNRIQHLKKWSGTNFYEISQRNLLDIEFSLRFKNPRWGPERGSWVIWVDFQMLITLETVGVRS